MIKKFIDNLSNHDLQLIIKEIKLKAEIIGDSYMERIRIVLNSEEYNISVFGRDFKVPNNMVVTSLDVKLVANCGEEDCEQTCHYEDCCGCCTGYDSDHINHCWCCGKLDENCICSNSEN